MTDETREVLNTDPGHAEQAPPRSAASAIEAIVVLTVTLFLALRLGYPTLWFVVPFAIVTLTRRPYEQFGLTLQNPGSVRFHLTVCTVVLGGYCAVHYGFGHWALGLDFRPTLAPDIARFVFVQFMIIGLCEEFFFRGYLQTQLNQWLGKPWRLLGARWGPGLILAAVLFGLCHVVTGGWTRMEVVAFGLFAGWLRERTGTITVPAVYHGFSNILYDFMLRSLQ